jgi:transposase InsO family protein
VLHTDASDYAFGAILMQEDEAAFLHPVAYASITLNSAQRNYSVTEREAMAIPWALEHFNTYLEGHKYTAITDHAALKYMWNNKDKTPRLLRALIRMQPYEIELFYKPGSQNHAADLLSREKEMMESKQYIKDNIANAPVINIDSIDNDNFDADGFIINNYGKKIGKGKAVAKPRIAPRRRKIEIDYDVEEIIDKKLKEENSDEYLYFVKWLGYDASCNTWEPIEHLDKAMSKVAEFEAKRQFKEKEIQIANEEAEAADLDISEQVIAHEQAVLHYVCNECGQTLPTATSLYLHKYKKHKIPIPLPSTYAGVIEENVDVLKQMQQRESEFKVIYDYLKGEPLSDAATLSERKMMSLYEFCFNSDDILFCVDAPTSRTRSRVRTRMKVCIPKPIRLTLVKEAHEGMLSPHPGVVHMYDKLREYVWWPAMLNDIIAYVKVCDKCQQRKKHMTLAPILPVSVPHGPWEFIGVDITGPFPMTSRNNQYILVVMDHFTRWAEAFPITDQTTETIADKILTGIICRYGLPRVILSDRGSGFISALAKMIYTMLNIKRVTTTAWHPQSNGIVERFNGTLKTMLAMWVNEMQTDWDVLLPYALFAYNVSIHRILQETPFYLSFARDARLPIDYIVTSTINDGGNASANEYAVTLVQKLKDVHTRVIDILNNINRDRNELLKQTAVSDIVVGDYVRMYQPTTEKGKSSKLTRRWRGPYKVVEIRGKTTYVIERNSKKVVVHVNRLKKAHIEEEDNIDTFTDQLKLAETELDSVNEAQQQMVLRQIDIKQRVAQLKALVENENENKNNDNDESEAKPADDSATAAVSMLDLTQI